MIKFAFIQTIVVSVSVLLWSVEPFARESSSPLAPLQSLGGKSWICVSWDGEKPKHRQTVRWEWILNGNAIREVMEKLEIGFRREGMLFWDGTLQQIRYLAVPNNGFSGHAAISWDAGVIVSLGKTVASDGGSMEQRETYELLLQVRLQFISYLLPSDDGWVQRHILEYQSRFSILEAYHDYEQ